MKRGLLFILALSFGLFVYGQQRAVLSKTIERKAVKVSKPTKGSDNPVYTAIPGQNNKSILAEENIGNTYYDLQSHASMQTRLHLFEDNTMGAVWTMGFDFSQYNDE